MRAMRKVVVYLLLVMWGVLFIASFSSFVFLEAKGDGFTRGMNRVGAFLGLQCFAGIAAIIAWTNNGGAEAGALLKWLTRIPVVLFGLLLSAIAGLFVYGNM